MVNTRLVPDLVTVDGDGYRSVEIPGHLNGQPDTNVEEIPVEEIRGPALQDWIERQMPHSD